MSPKRLLVVATVPVDNTLLRDRVREHAGSGAQVRIVAPASDLSPLQWLATDEDEARDEAADIARSAERAVGPEARAVETGVGDPDPVQAIEDALRQPRASVRGTAICRHNESQDQRGGQEEGGSPGQLDAQCSVRHRCAPSASNRLFAQS